MCLHGRAHLRHLANTIELVLPSAHPSPRPKQQIDGFSRFCTAHDRKSLYFTVSAHFPQNCPFPRGIWTPCKTWLLGPIRAHRPNGISIGSAVFAQMTAERRRVSLYFAMGCALPPSKLRLPMGDLDPHLIHGSLGHPCPQPKWHLDRFSHFSRAH